MKIDREKAKKAFNEYAEKYDRKVAIAKNKHKIKSKK